MENVETFFCLINFVKIAKFVLQRYFKLFISILTGLAEGCFFSYRPSSGIAPCVGTIGMVHMTPTLDAALLYVVHRDGVTTTSSRAGTDLGRLLDVESDASPGLRGGGSIFCL